MYVVQKLHGAEVKYTISEKESLAIVFTINSLKFYLTQTHFEILTDHLPLVFMKSQSFTNNRILRWIMFLQSYNFSISYIRGKKNNLADFLSRDLLLIEDDKVHASGMAVITDDFWSEKVFSNQLSSIQEVVLARK